MIELIARLQRDPLADVVTVRVTGRLTLKTAPRLRDTLLKGVAECPSTIIVDLSECDIESPSMLAVFPSVIDHRRTQPAVSMLVHGLHSDPWGGGLAALGPVEAHPTAELALAAASRARTAKRVELRLAQSAAAPGLAREAVRDACQRWDVAHVLPAAELVVSELVTNGVTHAGTAVTLELSLRELFFHIRVRDESSIQPTRRTGSLEQTRTSGRGLLLVEHYASAWGYVVDGAGKFLWATVRVRPPGTPP